MEWFTGGVVEAIAACRRNKALFVVYLFDDISASDKTAEAWSSDTVCEVLSSNKNYVAIKIAKGSLEHQQFSQLYPVFIFPSAFCIGLTGKTLIIMNGQHSSTQIKENLSEAFEKLQSELQDTLTVQSQATPTQPEMPPTQPETPPTKPETPLTQPETPPTQPETPPTQPETASTQPETLPTQPQDMPTSGVSSNNASLPLPVQTESSPPTNDGEIYVPPSEGSGAEGGGGQGSAADRQQETREEKIERAQQKVRQRRQEREETEFKKQKSAVLRRRDEGRQLAESRKDLEDLRNKTWLQERMKAKEEERQAREAIRAKLRQDQMEREALKRAREQTASELRQRSSNSSTQAAIPSSFTHANNTNGSCRLQLRLPSGEKSVVEMRTEDRLYSLRERVAEEVGVSAGGVVLSSTYPRRELTGDMDQESLAQLGLVPTGVIVVRFNKGSLGSGRQGGANTGWSLWGLIIGLFQLLMSLVAAVKRFCGCGDDSVDVDQTEERSYYSVGNSTRSDRVRKFRPGDYEEHSSDDDEERRNTYNGNSTEQQ